MPKPKFNEETREKILNVIREGNYMTTAAGAAGVDRRSVNRWLKRGREEAEAGKNTQYVKFLDDIEVAEAEGEFLLVNEVKAGGPKMALQILKRRYRERWGDKISTEHSGPGGGPIESSGSAITLNLTMQGGEEEPWVFDEDTDEVQSEKDTKPTTKES